MAFANARAQHLARMAGSFAKTFARRRVLITGGAGFIGSHLARRLVQLDSTVTVVDSLIPEYGGNLRNLAGIERKVRLHISDVRDAHSLPQFVKGQHFLFNLAGQTSHMDSMTDPQTDLEINTRAQLSILEACRRHNPGIRVVFASTRQVYGRPDHLPVDEEHPLRPVDVNGINKLAGESYHRLYNEVHGIPSCVLRLTNTIGPGMRVKDARQTFLGVWLRCLVEGRPFELWGGKQVRDFTYVGDAVDAFLLAATSPAAIGRIFNLGGRERISLRDLADLLVEVNGRGRYVIRPYPPDRRKIDVGDFYADYGLIQRTLGWRPRTRLRTALTRTLAYYRRELRHYL